MNEINPDIVRDSVQRGDTDITTKVDEVDAMINSVVRYKKIRDGISWAIFFVPIVSSLGLMLLNSLSFQKEINRPDLVQNVRQLFFTLQLIYFVQSLTTCAGVFTWMIHSIYAESVASIWPKFLFYSYAMTSLLNNAMTWITILFYYAFYHEQYSSNMDAILTVNIATYLILCIECGLVCASIWITRRTSASQ